MNLIYLIIGAIIGSLVIYLILNPKLKAREKFDEQTHLQNEQLKQQNIELTNINSTLHTEQQDLGLNCATLRANKETLLESIEEIKSTTDKYSKDYYNSQMTSIQQALDTDIEKVRDNYNNAADIYQQEYLNTLQSCVSEFQNNIDQKKKEIAQLNEKFDEAKINIDAAVEANKRLKKIEEDANFYKLVLLEDDIEEIQKLNEVSKYLRDPIPLYKVIWKYYYENPYNDLIGRVLGQNKHTGIYKITNQKDGLCYVGQAVDVAERWRQHIKRGLGAETPTRNKLYPAMKQLGVENFTFELIEECNAEKLNEREDFWQDYFHAKDFGYSIK